MSHVSSAGVGSIGVPDATTVSELVADYAAQGFVSPFSVLAAGRIRCGACRTASEADEVTVCALARAEGPSDPADMAIVAAVSCPWCAMSGVLVAGFGPGASAEDADVLQRLNDGRPTEGPVLRS